MNLRTHTGHISKDVTFVKDQFPFPFHTPTPETGSINIPSSMNVVPHCVARDVICADGNVPNGIGLTDFVSDGYDSDVFIDIDNAANNVMPDNFTEPAEDLRRS